MKLEAKVKDPITLKLSKEEKVYIDEKEKFLLENGVVFGAEHYGFNIITELYNCELISVYPTQCPIYGVQLANGILNVYETNKCFPWKFKDDGTILSAALFSTMTRKEAEYIADNYGAITPEEVAELNGKVICYKKIN